MNYSAHYQRQPYDPSYLTQQFYNQPTKDYYSYSYSNPQYTNIQPYSYQNFSVQPSQQQEQEPNPPGIAAPPPTQQGQSSYYQYQPHGAAVLAVCPQQGGVDGGVAVVHQPIVQSPYGSIGVAPQGGVQTHLGPKPKVSSRPYHVRGRGRGRGLHRHAAAPAQDQTVFIQGGPHIQGGPSQPMPESYASGFGPVLMPLPGPAHSVPVLLPPKLAWCDLCRVDCNTLEILEQHKNGKKHKKKLKLFEELQEPNKRVIDRQMELTSIFQSKPEVLSQPDQIEATGSRQFVQENLPSQAINEESKIADEKQKVEEAEQTEESKKNVMDNSEGLVRGSKRKMRGGKGSRRMQPYGRPQRPVEPPKPKEVIPLVCELCNVKCESSVVFQSHLVGKKHQAKAKRFLGLPETLGQAVLQALRPAIQAFHQQNPNASTPIASQFRLQGFGTYQGAKVGSVSQPHSLLSNFGAQVLMNAEGKSKEGHPESGEPSNCPTGSLVAAQMEGVATGSQPVTSGATLAGASVSEQPVVLPSSSVPGQDTMMGSDQVP